jgi:hypothetical protein
VSEPPESHESRPGRAGSDRRARGIGTVYALAGLVLVLIAVVVFLILDDSGNDSTTPATTTTTLPRTTTTPPTSTPTTSAPLPTTPDGFAQALFTAWQTANRALAGQVASPSAVTQMFSQAYPAGPTNPYTYQGCQGAAGSVVCTWQGNGQVIVMTVRNLTGGLPIQVEAVQFQSKA